MLQIVFELLATNGANNMICSRFWLLDALRMLLIFIFFAFHVSDVGDIFLVQKLCVLLGKFSLLLKLENRCAVRCKDIEGR